MENKKLPIFDFQIFNVAFNSKIKQLRGVCVDCVAKGDTSQKYIIADRCSFHYTSFRSKVNKEKKKNAPSRVFKRKATPPDQIQELLQQSIELEKFFQDAMEIISQDPHCWNCGDYILPTYYRHAVAHIFPKATFKSVRSHPFNWLCLGAHCCHDKSHTITRFKKMKVWPMAIERFKVFESQIIENHKYLSIFKQAI